MSQPLPNTRMPWFQFFWKDHAVKTSRLSWAERGFLEATRLEIASVEGCRLPLALLLLRLRVTPGSWEDECMKTLLACGLLSYDADDTVWAEDLVNAHAHAVAESKRKAENGRAGGRAKAQNARSTAPTATVSPKDAEPTHSDPEDF